METQHNGQQMNVQHLPTECQNLYLAFAWRKPLARICRPNIESHWMRRYVVGKFRYIVGE
ncbi:hypothetical protein TNCV_3900271, partial [Trichonephila clavipes]